MAQVHITVVGDDDSDERANGRFYEDDESYEAQVRAANAEQMVANILDTLGPDDLIAHLDIQDHGNRYGQRIGHSWLEVGSPALRTMRVLRPKMAPGGVVTLHGCRDRHHHKLLCRLSALLGVDVRTGSAVDPSLDLEYEDYPTNANDSALYAWLDDLLFY